MSIKFSPFVVTINTRFVMELLLFGLSRCWAGGVDTWYFWDWSLLCSLSTLTLGAVPDE